MTRHPTSPRDLVRMIGEREIQFLDLKFVDLFGTLQHLTLPAELVDEALFRNGMAFDGSSVRGFTRINQSDMLLIPDASSVFEDPFFDDPALSVFCDIVDPNGRYTFSRDPRSVARRAEQLVRSLGIADTAYLGPEIEFFVFDEVRFDQATQHGYFFLNSSAASWATGEKGDSANLGHRAAQRGAYFSAPPIDQYNNLRSKISHVLKRVGLQPELHHHEVGAAGQCEIGFRFGPLLSQADASIMYKYVVKNVVARYGKTATFMPKPLLQENGSGMHHNISLSKEGKNVFYQAGTYGDLSPLAVHFIGGLLEHARALCGICCPTTNSYRRLVPGYEAPMNLLYSGRNRSACIRIPTMTGGPKSKRIEFRTPDPSCNPYLSFAAIMCAGIDGIRRGLEPADPVDEDIYELAAGSGGREIERTPGTLDEAISALEADYDFLVRDGVFTEDLIETWIDYKRKNEIDYVRLRPHPGEFALYFNA
jgi:glutamine synthetase